LHDDGIVEEVIPNIVSDQTNNLPTLEEILSAVTNLKRDSAPDPDGFGAFFFHKYWSIIKEDVISAISQFFTNEWILPNYNSNIIVLIPKQENADSIDQFRPIAPTNFKHKILTKILADRLAQIMPTIISKEQRAFIHGRNIRDCICLTSEAINLLHNKCFGGNVAMKIDISKAFDTIDWKFLLKVLHAFGLSDKFCNFIEVILNSAYLSVSINGNQKGYFKCKRGVRQGDPLSPLLFCLAEDVLSRSITKLVKEEKIRLIKGTRTMQLPSHTLYADDIMLFCQGNSESIKSISDLLKRYSMASGQHVNLDKSIIYTGAMTTQRQQNIANILGF